MGDEIDAVDRYGNRYKARKVGSSGGGCFSGLLFWVGAVVLVIGLIVYGIQSLIGAVGHSIDNYNTYHQFNPSHNDAVKAAVNNVVGTGKYVGLAETDAGLTSKDVNLTDVTLDPELGGFPGKAYRLDSTGALTFTNVGIPRQGHCLLTVYIQGDHFKHSIAVSVQGNGDESKYLVRIPPSQDNGSVDIGSQAEDQYAYTVNLDTASPETFVEAIVVERPAQSVTENPTTTTAKPTPTPIRLAAKYNGTLNDSEYDPPVQHHVALEITKTHADGSFEGKLYYTYTSFNGLSDEDVTNVYSAQGVSVPFDKTKSFSQINPDKVVQLQQQVGENGALLQFTVTSLINGDEINGMYKGCEFYGVLTGGSVQGVWFTNSWSSGGSPTGTFTLNS